MTTDTIATTARELADALDWINADTDVRDAFPGVAVEDLETILSVMRALTAAMAGE